MLGGQIACQSIEVTSCHPHADKHGRVK